MAGIKGSGCGRKPVPTKQIVTNNLFSQYKSDAFRRNKSTSFKLTKKQFQELIFDNCFYCGVSPSNLYNNYSPASKKHHKPMPYNGIDRLDSSKGYIEDNVVTCCITCNRAKDVMSKDRFLNWISIVYHYKIGD